MPLYEYRCESCGGVFEVIQKFSDNPLTVHESCGGTVARLISSSAFHFKGSGWYVTDYARKSSSKHGEDSGNKTGDGAKPETKSESKSESKAESKTEPKTESKPAAPASSSADK